MPDETQFHLTVVTQKRIPRRDSPEARRPAAREARVPDGERRPGGARHGHREEHRSHRHYRDYGTVDLGSLEGAPSRHAEAEPVPAAPTKGAVQREFYDKYDRVLSRRYVGHGQGFTVRIIVIALLAAAIVLAGWIGVSLLGSGTGETLPKPVKETLPMATIDLG